MRKIFLVFSILFVSFVLVSCASTYEDKPKEEKTVRIIDVNTTDDIANSSYFNYVDGSGTLVQPEGSVISSSISIDDLLRSENSMYSTVFSSAETQAKVKQEIQKSIDEGNKDVDTKLDDTTYSQNIGTTSGDLAKKATENSFTYINSLNSYQQSIAVYNYMEGRIYEIVTSPNSITDFRLRPGETISGEPVVNDGGTNWNFTIGTSTENGQTIQHIFIKPSIVGLDTSLIILTNQRTYYFRIASFSSTYMTAVKFNYPGDSNYSATSGVANTMPGVSVSEYLDSSTTNQGYAMNMTLADYNYRITDHRGKPAWKPQTCFSDNIKTCIQFPVEMASSTDLPTPYIVSNGTENLVNFHYFGNVLLVDAVLTGNQYILLKNSQNQQVKITRR